MIGSVDAIVDQLVEQRERHGYRSFHATPTLSLQVVTRFAGK